MGAVGSGVRAPGCGTSFLIHTPQGTRQAEAPQPLTELHDTACRGVTGQGGPRRGWGEGRQLKRAGNACVCPPARVLCDVTSRVRAGSGCCTLEGHLRFCFRSPELGASQPSLWAEEGTWDLPSQPKRCWQPLPRLVGKREGSGGSSPVLGSPNGLQGHSGHAVIERATL